MNPDEILYRAAGLLNGDRATTHGPFVRSLQNIAHMWNAYLSIRREPSLPLGPTDVAHLMALLKVARTQNGETNIDNWVDSAAYVSLAGALNEDHPSTGYGRGNNNPGKGGV